jgi:divalent metal cation (Fe/Co/Zn/Cd) transporter
MGDALFGSGDDIEHQRFRTWEAWLLLVGVVLIFVGASFFLYSVTTHSEWRWPPLPGWVAAAVGIVGMRLLIGRANRREGKPFTPTKAFDDVRDVLSAGRTVGLPASIIGTLLIVGYAVVMVGFVRAILGALTSP